MTTLPNTPSFYSVGSVESILHKFITSGINISPKALLYLNRFCPNESELENFIQKISFQKDFGSYVSLDMVQEEFTDVDALVSGTDLFSQQISQEVPYFDTSKTQLTYPQNSINSGYTELKANNDKIIEPPNEFEEEDIPSNPFDEDIESVLTAESKPPIEVEKTPPLTTYSPEIAKMKPSGTVKVSTLPGKPFGAKKRVDEDDSEGYYTGDEEQEEGGSHGSDEDGGIQIDVDESEVAKIREEKRKLWESLQLRHGTSSFKPIASEYPAEIKVLSDPTGKIFSQGNIDEFVVLQNDKFNKIKNILSRRPEAKGLLDIGMINRLENPVEVQFIGMVVDKRQTSNKNYIIVLEDPTGICSVLVRPEPAELYTLMEKLLPDHVVIIDGFLRVNPQEKSRLVIANNVIFPDVPNTHAISYPEEDLAICLISDTHFGSKDWLEKVWHRFVSYLNCRIGNEGQMAQAGKVKYLTIAGDLVDGIGIYWNQEKQLSITDIYEQYEAVGKYFAELPDYITIIFSPGDHDAVRKAIPSPAVPIEITKEMNNIGVKMVGCPAIVSLHGIKTELFHGTPLIDMNMSIPGLSNEDPRGTMVEMIRARHLAPTYGKKTELAPTEQDWLVLETLPDILHTGHLHKNGCGWYKDILCVNSGCFQSQTDYMKSFGIDPDFGKPTIVNIKGPRLTPRIIDLVGDM